MTVSPLSRGLVHIPQGYECQGRNADLFFAERPEHVETAKALCRPCPARAECLAGALERREPWGVWGGQLLVNGVVTSGKRPRGRPRKNRARP